MQPHRPLHLAWPIMLRTNLTSARVGGARPEVGRLGSHL
jgi:hypothetical protein